MTNRDPDPASSGQGLLDLLRADFEAQAARIGRRRVLVNEGYWLGLDFRIRHWIWSLPPGLARTALKAVDWPFHKLVKAITRSGIGPETRIGPGVVFMHFGGVWIHPGAEIGADCEILHQVTIAGRGRQSQPRAGFPRIGDRVTLMAGAKVLGPVTIGDDAQIGANAVVLEDVPAGALAVGNPARVIRRKD